MKTVWKSVKGGEVNPVYIKSRHSNRRTVVCFSFFFWLSVLDKAEYSALESTLNSSIVSYRNDGCRLVSINLCLLFNYHPRTQCWKPRRCLRESSPIKLNIPRISSFGIRTNEIGEETERVPGARPSKRTPSTSHFFIVSDHLQLRRNTQTIIIRITIAN